MTKLRAWRFFSVVMAVALILGVGAIVVPTGQVGADEEAWDIQTVDDINVNSTSLALDSNGNPHISYASGGVTLTSLHYARWTGTAWAKETVDEGQVVVCSLALDSNDLPHIAYATGGPFSLHYAHWTGTAWVKETVDVGSVWDCSLALDSNDRPHISYSHPTDSLLYTYRTDTGWSVPETVDARSVLGVSLALDSNDRPHISYSTAAIGQSLHYARWTGTAWAKETVDVGSVWDCSLALDSNGYPHISYATADVVAGSLHYARWTGTAWAKETVDPAEVMDCSLALDSNDRPHISYFAGTGGFFDSVACAGLLASLDGGAGVVDVAGAAGPAPTLLTGMLKYANLTDSAWDIQTVDQETTTWEGFFGPLGIGSGGKWSSIALDGNDNPHISYGDLVPSVVAVAPLCLHYAHLTSGTYGATGQSPVTGVSPAPPHPLNPAQMTTQFLNVSPQQASVNQPVTIITNVVNTGDEAGNLNIALKINGLVEQSRMVSVGAHGTQPVKFTVTRDKPGTYTVDIAGQNGSFTILGDSSTGGSKTGGLLALALMGILIIASVVVLLVRRT